ncbi:AAA family ATPase [Dictyobacter vulcani]|nr:AAA family ATPase [Dictyobacter vulcani]
MAELALFLFGSPNIEYNGTRISVDTRKASALLIYLVMTRRRHRRDALANLLWPDYDQTHARATLRRTLSVLNKALDNHWLQIDRDTLAIDSHAQIWLDVEAFHAQLAICQKHAHPGTEICQDCQEPLQRAVELYQAEFLAGFHLHGNTNFESWQFFQADHLRREYAYALERLVQCYCLQGHFDHALSYAQRWLALDRLHEPAQRMLMQVYAWSGQRAAALYQYEECVRILQQELEIPPLEATTQLYQTIKENRLPTPPLLIETSRQLHKPVAQPISTTNMQAHTTQARQPGYLPLIGRSTEWEILRSAYQKASSHGQILVLEGELGIGKTRLAEELLTYARQQDATILMARCYEAEQHMDYSSIVAGLRAAMVQQQDALKRLPAHWLTEVARLLPELDTYRQDPVPRFEQPGSQYHLFESLRQFFLSLCRNSKTIIPGIIFFEDIHWIDAASLEFLIYCLRRSIEKNICLFLTYRTPRRTKDYQLHHLLSELQQNGQATLLKLERLQFQEVSTFMTSNNVLPDLATMTRLYQESEGLPFLLIEYLANLQTGTRTPKESNWPVPAHARDLLHLHMAAISETARQVLGGAATIGRTFDFDTLCETCDADEKETVAALEELIDQGFILEVRTDDGTQIPGNSLLYRFSHEKTRQVAYEEISQARRRLFLRRKAEIRHTRARGDNAH